MNENEHLILKKIVSGIGQLNEDAWNDFAGIWRSGQEGRKQLLTAAGETEKYLYVILDGVQRVYYFDEKDREATLVFTYAPSFGGVLDSFLLQQPSAYFYETLTPSRFLKATYADVDALMSRHRSIEAFIRKGVTHATSGILERLTELQCFSAAERFRCLLKRSPHILQLVPHKYLANYLGMDATNFSKLINKVKI